MKKLLLCLFIFLLPSSSWSANRFWVGGTGAWTTLNITSWSLTTGGVGGATVPGSGDVAIFDAASGGGTVTPNYDMTLSSITMGAFTGTLDFSANNNSPTLTSFSGTGAGTRTLNMGSGTWTITGNAATVWTFTTATGLTFNAGTGLLRFTYSGGTGTRTIATGNLTYYDLSITAGSDIVTHSGGMAGAHNINFTGYTGAYGGSGAIAGIMGNYTLGTGMTATHTGSLTFAGTSGTQIFTSNGVSYAASNTIMNGIGGTLQFADALSSVGSLTLTNGTIDAATNNVNITLTLFSSANSNTRVLLMGTGTWTLTSTATIWNTSVTTGFALTPSTSTIKFTNNSTSSKTFSGGGLTFGTLWNATLDTGVVIISGSNTFNTLKIDAGRTVQFSSGTTQTITTPTITGSAGNLITLTSTTTTNATITLASGTVALDYISASKLTCTGGGVWDLGTHSVDGGNNGGCTFPLTNRKALAFLENN